MCSIKVVQTSFCTKPKPSFKFYSLDHKMIILYWTFSAKYLFFKSLHKYAFAYNILPKMPGYMDPNRVMEV